MICVLTRLAIIASAMLLAGPGLDAQSVTSNPFRPTYGWGELPAGHTWGSTSAVDIAADGNIWVTDAWAANATTTGHTVLKFSPEGKLLMTIGKPDVAGDPPTHLSRPSGTRALGG
jgi:hypothetical protein